MKSVLVQFPLYDVDIIDKLVSLEYYPNRNEAIRFAVHDLIKIHRSLGHLPKEGEKRKRNRT